MPFIKRHARNRRRGKGAIAVEFAFAVPIFFAILFAIVELGRVVMVHQLLTNAAREGARYAIVPGRTDEQVNAKVEDYLRGVFPEKTDEEIAAEFSWGVTPSLSEIDSGDSITVAVQVPFSDVAWGVHLIMSADATMGSQVTMRKE